MTCSVEFIGFIYPELHHADDTADDVNNVHFLFSSQGKNQNHLLYRFTVT